ncbi:tetratricopeptide repeat protein [uncultured Rhodoferax sp.]|uniref:tetratricopeptide repeat protein n=1 Tax=uncultured Rhodoferax sp. TaxID=223188 RepID=UPI0025FE4A83|nr:tetratricopeptide repeat protein [uncultured Rhodoferax sp.]
MSVINKMLRDLDQRQAPGTGATDPLRRATASVAAMPAPRSPRWGRWTLGLGCVAAAAVAGWWWDGQQAAPVPVAVTQPAQPAIAAVSAPAVAASAPVVEAVPAVAVASAPVAAPVAAVPTPLEPAAAMSAASAIPAPTKAQVAAASPLPASVGLRMDSRLSAPSAALLSSLPKVDTATKAEHGATTPAPNTAPPKPASPAAEVPAPTRQLQASREALAQAQSLWASGARDMAISTLQDAVAVAERTPPTAGVATLVPMVRELARMQLAEGQVAAAWDLLARMEPLLANQPELWALRANAAQRLGRHQESVQAYNNALQSRPGEQRWLLGAAVSLAALGQTSAAADMAERARNVGPVSRDVLAYLRQQGVPLPDRP